MDLNKIYSDLDNIVKTIEQVKEALGAANVTTQRTAEAPAPTRNRSLEEVKNVCNRWINEKHLDKGEDIQIIYNVINEYSSIIWEKNISLTL